MIKFRRDIYSKLAAWKIKEGRKPLLLMRARQIGKTTILKAFGANEYEDVLYINLEKDIEAHSFFEGNKDPKSILDNLSLFHGKKILPERALLLLDEIQECRGALTAFKIF